MYNNNGYGQQGYGRGRYGPLGLVVKGIAQGIGLASEGIHAHKEKKAAEKAAEAEKGRYSQSQPPPPGSSRQPDYPSCDTPPTYEEDEKYNVRPENQRSRSSEKDEKGACAEDHELEEGDEEQWDLDDAQDELMERVPLGPKTRKFVKNPQTTVQNFIDDYPLPQGYNPHGRLTLPVIIPQRRPKDRLRGFIRAYAPELMNNHIDQDMFLDFLETLHLASQPSPWINAINLAGFATIPLAFPVGQAVSIAIMLTVSLMKNMDSRKRCNTVLDQFNEQFFQPRGLYCMILTWAPESDSMEVGININETIHQNTQGPPEGLAKVFHNFRPSMGKTNGVAFTETAPLVFPVLDKLDDNHSAEAKSTKEKLNSAMSFTSEYYDRRAQAKFAAEAPDSQLVVGPKPTFTSRYSDPNNPTNSGSILALLTAGKLSLPPRGSRLSGPIGRSGGMGRGFGMRRGPLGMLGMLAQSRGGGMSQQQMQQQMMLEQEQMMINQQKYPNQAGAGGMRGQDQTANQTEQPYPQQRYQQYAQQLPNQQHSQQMQNQMYAQKMGNMGPGMYPTNPIALLGNGVKRILSHHVLYLLITNMPTEEEMTDAKAFMDQVREAQKQSS